MAKPKDVYVPVEVLGPFDRRITAAFLPHERIDDGTQPTDDDSRGNFWATTADIVLERQPVPGADKSLKGYVKARITGSRGSQVTLEVENVGGWKITKAPRDILLLPNQVVSPSRRTSSTTS